MLKTGIAHEGDVMSFLFAPHGNDLRHDAGKIGIHDTRVQGAGRTFRDQVDDPDTALSHTSLSCVAFSAITSHPQLRDAYRMAMRTPVSMPEAAWRAPRAPARQCLQG